VTLEETYRIIEGLIFAAPYPLTVKEISEITEIDEKIVQRLIEDVAARYENSDYAPLCGWRLSVRDSPGPERMG